MMAKREVGIVLLTLLAVPAAAHGHPVSRQPTREIIRIQGYRATATPAAVKRTLTLVTLGKEHSFAATDWQAFGFSEGTPESEPPAADGQRFSLQGSREELMRFSAARPEQRVTLLVEHRPGSTDLFILALDLCPP